MPDDMESGVGLFGSPGWRAVLVASPFFSTIAVAMAAALPLFEIDIAWSLALVAGAFGAQWPVFIQMADDLKRVDKLTSANHRMLETSLKISVERDPDFFNQILRSGFFGGSEIDDAFWLSYCEVLKARRSGQFDHEILRDIVSAIENKAILVRKDDSYPLMKKFCDQIFADGKTYLATTTDEDLDRCAGGAESFIRFFVFEFPKRYPKNIKRIFIVGDQTRFAKLPDELQKSLADQISTGCDLRVLVDANQSGKNFGIYGETAVGVYDEASGQNKVVFERSIVRRMTTRFQEMAEMSKPLELGN